MDSETLTVPPEGVSEAIAQLTQRQRCQEEDVVRRIAVKVSLLRH
jgi:hypothetical protein